MFSVLPQKYFLGPPTLQDNNIKKKGGRIFRSALTSLTDFPHGHPSQNKV